MRAGMLEAGESKKTRPLTGALSTPEAPNPKHQAPKKSQIPNFKNEAPRLRFFGVVGFKISLGFGFWDLGFRRS
jgi:hypothetical protein